MLEKVLGWALIELVIVGDKAVKGLKRLRAKVAR